MSSVLAPSVEPDPPGRLATIVAITAAGLIGFGLIMVIAANWAALGAHGQTALIGTVIGLSALTAALYPRHIVPSLFIAFAGVGGLLAHLGITYQSGGDPWQLFALWAALTLPFALAARHDALWTAWVTVAITALPLWLTTNVGGNWFAATGPSLVVWIIALAFAAALSPWSPLAHWLGTTRWAFRLATVQTLILITTRTIAALFTKHEFGLFLLGILLVAGITYLLITTKPFDFPLFAASVIATDALLIALLWRLMERGFGAGSALLLGILSTGIIVATARMMIAVANRGIAGLNPATWQSTEDLPAGVSTWPAIALSAVGATFAAVPFVSFYALTFGMALNSGGLAVIVGLATIAAGALCAMHGKAYGFGQIFGLIAIVTGKVMLAIGFGTLVGTFEAVRTVALALFLVNVLLAAVVPVGWLAALFGFSAAAALAVLVGPHLSNISAFRGPQDLIDHLTSPLLFITAIGALALYAVSRRLIELPASLGERLTPFFKGWSAACLAAAALLSGPTFLVGATVSTRAVTATWQGQVFAPLSTSRVLALLLALASIAAISTLRGHERPTAQHIAIALTAALFAYVMPAFTVILMVLAVMASLPSRAGIATATLAGLWCLGAFYYSLALPLMTKGLLLIAVGGGLFIAAAADGLRTPFKTTPTATVSPVAHVFAPAVIYGLIAAGVIGTAASAASTIATKTAVIRDGSVFYVRLAPVDPRSLMQGDFMALRFAMPNVPKDLATEPNLVAFADVDSRSIAVIKRIGTPSEPSQLGQRRIILTRKAQWTIATDAFFFKEGTGQRYETARYGIFRMTEDGQAVLTGLATDKLVEIK